MSKLTFADTQKFIALLEDVFPGIKSVDIVYESVSENAKSVLLELKLDIIDSQIAKIL